MYSAPSRGAGGARNVGISHAHGKWLIFADADDYFTPHAFEIFDSKRDSDADVIFTCAIGKYIGSNEPCSRGDSYTKLVQSFLDGRITEMDIRLHFVTPWAKMVRRSFVTNYNLRFDEVVACNDVYFSLLCGYYAKKIDAVDGFTYVVTASRGTLSHRQDYAAIEAKFHVHLRYNRFLKDHNLGKHQMSIMRLYTQAASLGFKPLCHFTANLFKYRQNPFIGCSNWLKTWLTLLHTKKQRARLITK